MRSYASVCHPARQHVAKRQNSRLRSILERSEEWTPFEAWRNLLLLGFAAYVFCGLLTFWVSRDGVDAPVIEHIFRPIHWFIRWSITRLFG